MCPQVRKWIFLRFSGWVDHWISDETNPIDVQQQQHQREQQRQHQTAGAERNPQTDQAASDSIWQRAQI